MRRFNTYPVRTDCDSTAFVLFFSFFFLFVQIRVDGRTDPDTYLPLLLARLHFLDRDGVRRGAEEKPTTTVAEASITAEGKQQCR